MASKPTFFVDDAAATALQARVPGADLNSGMFAGASNSPGIGINVGEGAIADEPQQFTVLDQFGDPRQPQIGQLIGGNGITETSDWPGSGGTEGTAPDSAILVLADPDSTDGSGTITLPAEGAWLADAETGWTEGDEGGEVDPEP
tara:strand:- start:45 stop:479 length:435 start_codon:yes stop_codon:yes gene_type:complete